jgi:hypothetical protein
MVAADTRPSQAFAASPTSARSSASNFAQIGEDGAHRALRLGRDRDLIHGGQRADDIHRPPHGVPGDNRDRNPSGRAVARFRVSGLRLAATARDHRQEHDDCGVRQAMHAVGAK